MAKKTEFRYYNQNIKEAFIADAYADIDNKIVADDLDACRFIMEKIAALEEDLGKDLYEFNDREYMEVARSYLNRIKSRKRVMYIRQIEKYLDWCLENEYIDSAQRFLAKTENFDYDVENDSHAAMHRNGFLGSYDEFVEYCDLFFYGESMVMQRAVACLSWIGFSGAEINMMLATDFDAVNRMICGKYVEDDYVFDALVAASEARHCYALRGSLRTPKYIEYTPSKYFIKTNRGNTEDERNDKNKIIASISRLIKTEKRVADVRSGDKNFTESPLSNYMFSAREIMYSGMLWRIYQHEVQSGAKLKRHQFEALDEHTNNHARYSDYLAWRKAFHE